MTVFSALYKLLIGPLELFFDVLYCLAFRFIGNEGLAIVVLSLGMNFLVLPLYRRADALQAEERDLEQRLQPRIRQIKKAFTGDERFMMLQTYYRQNGYKPTDSLKGSLSLLLEIPFFIAAYRFLSGLNLLDGVSFGPIRDLGAPDALLTLGGVGINLLPILMTAVNLVSGWIYTRGMPAKNKVQLYGMALIFLALLYPSPSGLVFYWTLNNLFSLAKNIFYKLKNPALVLDILFSAAGAALLGLILFVHPVRSPRHLAAAAALIVLLQVPLALYLLRRRGASPRPVSDRQDPTVFRLGCLVLTLLAGVLIPSAVIKSSPSEFVNIYAFRSPLLYVLHAALLAAGTFLIWPGVFYALSGAAGKRILELGVWLASGCALIDYMFFGTDLGTLSPTLQFTQYETRLSFPRSEVLLNLLALLLAAALLFFLWKKRRELARYALLAIGIALLGMSAWNLVQIRGEVAELKRNLEEQNAGAAREEPSLPLSRSGNNVVVIMLDRAISGYLPYLVHEKPELKEQFDGFVYYPNTVSFGGYTNIASPALYGGYEYTPLEMNRRSGELLADKHDEALLVMPVLFDRNGFRVTVCDPTYAGYQMVPDLSIYDEYPGIRAFITKGRYLGDPAENAAKVTRQLNRNFFCYGLLKCAPLLAQPSFYVEGMYCESNAILEKSYQTRENLSVAYGRDVGFMESYSTLEALPAITVIENGQENNFLLFTNETPHEPMMLQEPEYRPADRVDNRDYDAAHALRETDDGRAISFISNKQVMHYQANMASLLLLGQWLDGLRESGVYDNTRIIIVADHGRQLDRQLDYLCFFDGRLDVMYYNPLLLVKDFNSSGALRTDDRFMTNADVPTLAMAGLIDDPVNPFTGKPINDRAKEAAELFILVSDDWDITANCGTVFNPGHWVSVHDDIFDSANWSLNADARAK